MDQYLKIIFLAIFLTGCSISKHYPPSQTHSDTEILSDCTEVISKYMEWKPPQTSTQEKENAIKAASAWAQDHCYFPCDFKMCATITKFNTEEISVYISHDVSLNGQKDENGDLIITIGPEASVTFKPSTYKVLSEAMYHSGCRFSSNDCQLFKND